MTKEALKKALEALVLNNAEWKHLADSGDSGDSGVNESGVNESGETDVNVTNIEVTE